MHLIKWNVAARSSLSPSLLSLCFFSSPFLVLSSRLTVHSNTSPRFVSLQKQSFNNQWVVLSTILKCKICIVLLLKISFKVISTLLKTSSYRRHFAPWFQMFLIRRISTNKEPAFCNPDTKRLQIVRITINFAKPHILGEENGWCIHIIRLSIRYLYYLLSIIKSILWLQEMFSRHSLNSGRLVLWPQPWGVFFNVL